MFARHLIQVLIVAALTVVFATAVRADDKSLSTKATEAILIDARNGQVLFEKAADLQIPPASMSKLMTMILVFEALKAGKLSLDQEFVISADAWRRGGASSGGSTMYAELNSHVKLGDLIQGVIVQSANDACIAIAEGMAGSEEAFAALMTKRARELGLAQAVFRNATGLPDPDHKMSVRELSILARYIIQTFPEYYKYYSEPEFTWNKITQKNRNPLLTDYPGADGMKTGYTKEAGYGLVGSATRGGRRLIMVIAGLESLNDRKIEGQRILDWGFSQYREIAVLEKGDTLSPARVWGGDVRQVNLIASLPLHVSLSPQEQAIAELRLAYTGPLMAPVKAGDKVGEVRVTVAGETVAATPVEAASDVAPRLSMWSRAFDSLLMIAFGG